MNVSNLLSPEVLDIAKAAGLVSASGEINDSWFNNPLDNLRSVLTNSTQRAALLDLLDIVLPPQAIVGVPSGEKWHPLLGMQPAGNLYLTVSLADPLIMGLAGAYTTSPTVSALCRMPMASLSGTAFTPISGTATGPLELDLAVMLNWTRPATKSPWWASQFRCHLRHWPLLRQASRSHCRD